MPIIIILAIAVLIIYFYFIKPFIVLSKLKLDHFTLITGGVGTGKSTLAIYLSLILYYNTRRIVIIENFFKKLFKKGNMKKLPLLYSNIPIASKYGYAPLTKEILLRQKKPIERSIIYIGEFSLVADSMNFKDMILNEQIMLFFKLFRHSFKGKIIADTQNVSDIHHAVKKICNSYIWIEKGKKSIFNYNMNIRKMYYNYDNNGVMNNLNNKDMEKETQLIKVNLSIWKKYDSWCYSVLTDHLEEEENNIELKDIKTLKQPNIISFNKWLTTSIGGKKEDGKQTK